MEFHPTQRFKEKQTIGTHNLDPHLSEESAQVEHHGKVAGFGKSSTTPASVRFNSAIVFSLNSRTFLR
jgi:hypothetical protein